MNRDIGGVECILACILMPKYLLGNACDPAAVGSGSLVAILIEVHSILRYHNSRYLMVPRFIVCCIY